MGEGQARPGNHRSRTKGLAGARSPKDKSQRSMGISLAGGGFGAVSFPRKEGGQLGTRRRTGLGVWDLVGVCVCLGYGGGRVGAGGKCGGVDGFRRLDEWAGMEAHSVLRERGSSLCSRKPMEGTDPGRGRGMEGLGLLAHRGWSRGPSRGVLGNSNTAEEVEGEDGGGWILGMVDGWVLRLRLRDRSVQIRGAKPRRRQRQRQWYPYQARAVIMRSVHSTMYLFRPTIKIVAAPALQHVLGRTESSQLDEWVGGRRCRAHREKQRHKFPANARPVSECVCVAVWLSIC